MAGIYIHIPFCRQRCFYCDFYKTLDTSLLPEFISALKKEIVLRKNYLENEPVKTIYFGGGTPSVLSEKELNEILSFIKAEFTVHQKAEITFEANPDDLTPNYLQQIYNAGINRLSIGIQSFNDELLKSMNRRHSAFQAIESVKNAVKSGIKNISIDLIYGLPNLTHSDWEASLEQIFALPVTHLSAYHLTYHKGTNFYKKLKNGTLKETTETESISQFNTLIEITEKNGFEQYEISNFAKNKLYSKHNTSYWTGEKYIGLGPSAHSFNGISRQWNISHTKKYISEIENGRDCFEEEILTENDKFNEYILTRIRTIWGVSLNEIENYFGIEKKKYFLQTISQYKNTGLIVRKNNVFTLSKKGLFISDEIMTNLMIV